MTAAWIGIILGFSLVIWWNFSPKLRRLRAEEAARIVCPYCQTQGSVSTQSVRRKQGISGAKATGALMTGGMSMFATGLSRKQSMTHMQCRNCGVSWDA